MLELSPVQERTEEALSFSDAEPVDSFDDGFLGPAEPQPADYPAPQQEESTVDSTALSEPAHAEPHPADSAQYAEYHQEADAVSDWGPATASHTEADEFDILRVEHKDAVPEEPLHSYHAPDEHAGYASRRMSSRTSNGAVAGSTIGRSSTVGRRSSDLYSHPAAVPSARHSEDFPAVSELASEQRYDFRYVGLPSASIFVMLLSRPPICCECARKCS